MIKKFRSTEPVIKKFESEDTIVAEKFDGSIGMVKKYHIDAVWIMDGHDYKQEFQFPIRNNGRMSISVGDWIAKIGTSYYPISKNNINSYWEEVED